VPNPTTSPTPALLADLFHHRWAAPVLALLDDRGGARFVEFQRSLNVGRESLQRALRGLIDLGYVQAIEGYGHPLRPEYAITEAGRQIAYLARNVTQSGAPETLLHKWSVPVIASLDQPRRFSELRSALPAVTPRALAIALRELESADLVRREVLPTRPPATLYRCTPPATRILRRRRTSVPSRA
jgi:DNA-binding HxlR family transcriptional regulator